MIVDVDVDVDVDAPVIVAVPVHGHDHGHDHDHDHDHGFDHARNLAAITHRDHAAATRVSAFSRALQHRKTRTTYA